jgi:hypothetical protein
MSSYRNVDAMIDRLLQLHARLSAPQGVAIDRLRMITAASASITPPHASVQHRLLVEKVDIICCIRDARLNRVQLFVLSVLFRPRHRYCRRCARAYPAATEVTAHCPRCHATRDQGWTYEAFPTNNVLAEELTRFTRTPWYEERTRRFRNRVYDAVEESMKRRGLWYYGQAASA